MSGSRARRARWSRPSRSLKATTPRRPRRSGHRPPARHPGWPTSLARHARLVVENAEDPAAVVAVAREGGVAVDAGLGIGAAVEKLADRAAAAAIPAAVDASGEVVSLRDPVLAEAGARRLRHRL